MAKLNAIELKRACLVPSSVFTSPEAVVRSTALTRAQKIQILRRWEFDARGPANFATGAHPADFSGLLSQLQVALATLGALPPQRPHKETTRH